MTQKSTTTPTTPTVYLDIDGVVFAYGLTAPAGTGLDYEPHPVLEHVWYAPAAARRINALAASGVRFVWLSSVQDKAGVCRVTGIDGVHWTSLDFQEKHRGFDTDWKLLVLAEDLAAHRPTDWVWIEDGLLDCLGTLVNPAHLILPDSRTGLTAGHLAEMETRFGVPTTL